MPDDLSQLKRPADFVNIDCFSHNLILPDAEGGKMGLG